MTSATDAYEAAVEAKKVAEQEVETEKKKQEKLVIQQQTAVDVAKLEIERKKLVAEANKVESTSLTPEILRKLWIEKWDGKLPETIVTDNPNTFLNLPSK